jgi:thiopeptide-type bacteriocin biosynthesis protein
MPQNNRLSRELSQEELASGAVVRSTGSTSSSSIMRPEGWKARVAGRGGGSTSDRLALSLDRILVENRDPGDAAVRVGDRVLPLWQFLAYCASTVTAELKDKGDDYSQELRRVRDVFVRAGLEGLAAEPTTGAWLQIGIRPSEDLALRRELCQRIAGVARGLLSESAVDNFFFMHKAPGMRLRFERGRNSPHGLEEALYEEIADWRAEGLVEGVEPGVYEPESQLFGGQTSMKYAHALFTVDSLIWLDYHALAIPDGEDSDAAWLVSLASLAAVLDGLDITGWEDLGVWNHVREATRRHLAEDATSLPEYAEVARSVRAIWSRRDQLLELLHPDVRAIVEDHYGTLEAAAGQWRSGYFATRTACIGPREAAAFYIIFHWNRAALSTVRQALLTESLSRREA